MRWRNLLAVVAALVAAAVHTAPISAAEAEVASAGSLPLTVTIVEGAEVPAAVLEAAATPPSLNNALRANAAVPGQITVVYVQPTTPQNVKDVFNAAIAEWDRVLALSPQAPVEIVVDWRDLGDPNLLGSAGPASYWVGGPSLPPGASFPSPLANVLGNTDFAPAGPEIFVNFNSAFANWNSGLGPPAVNQYSLYTVALHELGHGFGFGGSLTESGFYLTTPSSYDFAVFEGVTRVVDLPNPGAAVTGNNLEIEVVNQGRFKLYAPNPFRPGSSYSHFDEATYLPGNLASLMTPEFALGEWAPTLTAPVIGVMETIGWPLEQGDTTPPTVTGLQWNSAFNTFSATIQDVNGVASAPGLMIDLGAAGATGTNDLRYWDGTAWMQSGDPAGEPRIPAIEDVGDLYYWNGPTPLSSSGSFVGGFQAFDPSGNKTPDDRNFAAVVVIDDFTPPTITQDAPVNVDNTEILFSGVASEDRAVRKVRVLIREVASNTYYDGVTQQFVSGQEATANIANVLLTADLGQVLGTNPPWTYSFTLPGPGVYQALAWAHNGAYVYSAPAVQFIVVPGPPP